MKGQNGGMAAILTHACDATLAFNEIIFSASPL